MNKIIACAVAAVCAQSAFALDFATTKNIQSGALAGSHAVYLSGASALKNSVPLALAKLCSDAVSTYTFAGDASNVKAYSCTIKSAAALLAENVTLPAGWPGSPLLMGLSVQNGSFTAVTSQNPTNVFLADGTTNAWNQQIDFVNGVNTAGSVSLATRRQTAGGFLDVNAAMFDDVVALNPTLSAPSYTSTSVAAGQSFGLAVSPSLYAALQNAQGLGACAGSRTSACQPNIAKGQYASMVASQNAGYIADWSVLGLTSAADSAQPVNICRRVATSGTQAASNLFFLGKGCSSGYLEPATAADTNPGVFNVTEGSGTANAIACVSNATNYAIGVVSVENAASSTVWKFVKLDGVAIDDTSDGGTAKARQTAIDQKYNFTYEFTIATRNSAPAGDKALLAALGNVISNPAVTNLVGIYTAPGTYDNASFPTQVAKATSGGNVCQSALTFF